MWKYEGVEKSYLSYYLAHNTVAFSQNNLMLLIFEKWATLNPTFVFKCSHIIWLEPKHTAILKSFDSWFHS